MAVVHPEAVLRPTKAEVAQQWVGASGWFDGDPGTVDLPPRSSYRFDDPAGKVGIETLVVRHGDRFIQIPLTYREAPLDGHDEWLLTTMEHSVLGPRWVYDGVGDPVLVTAFAAAIVGGLPSAGLELSTDDGPRSAETLIRAQGTGVGSVHADLEILTVDRSGSDSTVRTSLGDIRIPHLLDAVVPGSGPALLGRGGDLGGDVLLAELTTA